MKSIICGAGDVGYSIADKLSKENFEVIVIDESKEKLKKISDNLDVKTVLVPQVFHQLYPMPLLKNVIF